jgi:hypothetical protein
MMTPNNEPMNRMNKIILCGLLLFLLGAAGKGYGQGAHVSLWNFDSGDLSTTTGSDMEYIEDTADLVEFGTTEALGLPAINGEVANVIKIPKLTLGQGLRAPLPEDSNGEGDLVNNWTAIMDLYYPPTSSGKKRALIDIVTAEWVAGAGDAEFYVSAANAVGTSGLDFGNVTPGEWHRIAIAINIEGSWGKVYIDGQHVGGLTAPEDSLDGRWSLDTAYEQFVNFFIDDNNESEEVFVNSIQLRFEALNTGQILALGGAAAAGVPEELPPVPSFVDQWAPSGKYAKADTALSVVINPGDTTIGSDSISLTLNGETVATDIASADGILTVKASGLEALAKGVKYELVLTYTDSVAGEQTQSRKFEVPVYFEDFDSVELGPPVDELAVESEAAWTRTGPEGWTVDASGVPGNSEDHVGYLADEDEDGFPDNDGVTEWAGWSFADFSWWVQVAGDQSRSSFSLARNVVAVADPDEWDDKAHADGAANGWFKTFMTTPEIDVSGIDAGTLFANFHSSWRPEFDGNYHQEGYILASYDGAEPVEILTWVSDPGSPNYHDHNQNEVVTLPLNNTASSQKLQLTFGMREAGNDWWWAIDNLVINAGVVPPLIATQPSGTEVSEGEAFALSVVAEGGEPLSYQWYKDGVAIDGATSADFAVGQASVADAGNYSVKITNEGGDITSGDALVGVQASLGVTIWSEDFEGLELGPNVDEGLVGEQVWTKTAPEGWVINDDEVPGTWAWQGIDDEDGHPENDGVTEWAGWSFPNVKWWIQTAGDQRRSEFKKAIGAAAVADGGEWDDLPREGGNMNAFMTTESISIDGIMENSLMLRFHSSWRPEVAQTATVEATIDDGDPIEIMRWESEGGDAAYYHDHNPNETVNVSINNPAGAKSIKFTFGYLDAGNNWWWAVDNLILAGEPEPIFAENFDSLELDAFESSSETGGDGTDWTADTPTGWVMTKADDHGPTGDGDAVKEFDGWTFFDPVSWNATAGQDRAEFTKGTGVIAVGDSDEYDDLADAKFNASLSTPAFSLDGVAAGTAILVYDSSWRQEPQSGTVSVSFDGGDSITLLTLTPDTPTAYNETVTIPLGNPDGAKKAVITWDHQGHNNWWWAIDNIKVTVGKAPAGIVTQLTGVEATEGDGVSFSVKANGDEPIFYKWFKGDVEIAGAEGPVLELSNVSEENSGSYSVVVSNSAGSATSNTARLAVLLKPGSTQVFAEDFNSLELGPFVSDSESGGDGTDWTATAPEGWVQAKGDDHGPSAGGDDVVEFDGWTFLDPVSWNATAGQARGEFTKGTGVVAVGDSDEYDDKADAKFNASIFTPAISIAGIDPGSLILKYDSSWRKEPQNGTVSVAYDGGDAVTLVALTPETPSGYNDTVTVRLENPEGASSLVITWDHQGHNNWWWAIDNIEITGELQPIFAENFDSLELGPFVSDSESGGDGTDWTATAPEGWVQAKGDDHGPTAGGDVAVEFDGWTFLDPVSWNATAGQARAEFTKGTGVVAVGDSDEYDDKADAKFNASLSTPAIDISGAPAGSLLLTYDSSWRQEPQSGKVLVSYDGGEAVTLLELTPDTPTAYDESVELELNNPEGASSAVITWDHQGHNNWWWAIDNILVTVASTNGDPTDPGDEPTEKVIEEESLGDPVTYTNIAPTLIGQLSINGKAASAGDIVAIYVGEELRAKQEVSIDEEGAFSTAGTAWINAQVHSAGGQESVIFKVYEASTGVTFDKVAVGEVVIEPDILLGSFNEPLLIKADNVVPAIVLLGGEEVSITVGSEYEDAGAIATDNVDGDVTGQIVVNGAVDMTKAGVYTLIYSVSDAAGNKATATRTVTVEKILALLTLSGFNQTYDGSAKELNATAVDSADNELDVKIVMVYRDAAGERAASATNAGTYTVTATIDDDLYGGTATATLTIEKAEAVVMISDTIQTYDGEEKRVIVTTEPGGLDVESSYDGSETGPTEAGEYEVWVTVEDANYLGNATAILTIVEDPFGEPVAYANNTHTVYGAVTINGEAASKGDDVVAVYVGDELRGKHVVQAVNEGVAYVTIQVNVNEADEQTSRFVVWNADQIDEELKTVTLKKKISLEPGGETELLAFDFKSTLIQEVTLKKGWNLISFYVEADDMTPATVLESIKDKLVQIKNLKNSYNPTLPAFINTLKRLNVEDGYWVKMDADASFELEGSVPEGASIPVRTGWNLVGYPRESGAAPGTELTSLGGIVEQFKNLKSSYDPVLPPFLNTLKVVAPGLGYWLKVSENGVWNVGDVSGEDSNRVISKMGQDESRWGQVVVYPNVSATVLAQVTVEGKAVSSGSVVGAFVGDELRGQHGVVLADGVSYIAINVNLTKTEKVSFRIWDSGNNKDYPVVKTMTLEMGEMYGTAEKLVNLDGAVPRVGVRILSYTQSPFVIEFKGEQGRNYVVEATGDLKEWKLLKTLSGVGSDIKFTDTRKSIFEKQYYRVKALE